MIKATKTLGILLAGALLTFVLWNGYYYWRLAQWVDQKRTMEAIQQVIQQQQKQGVEAPK